MNLNFIDLPSRTSKPRAQGLTMLIDGGSPTGIFIDVINCYHSNVDYVKFGWGTSLITTALAKKIEVLHQNQIKFFFGGTLFEKALHQNKLDQYRDYLNSFHCEYMEISNGTLPLSNPEKCKHIKAFSRDFKVFSEVGYKDTERSLKMHPAQWVEFIKQDLEAGAIKVITESRESGTGGICRDDGELRYGLIEEILYSGIDTNDLIFEAPNKYLQIYFLNRLGINVNLANVSFQDIIGLETLRLGLRSDTFFQFDTKENEKSK